MLKFFLFLLGCCLSFSTYALPKEERVMPKNGIDKALLGQILFFDKSLSQSYSMNCASCHSPDHAFIDVQQNSAQGMVSQGDSPDRFGVRNSPTMLYARFSPRFHYDEKTKQYIGGQFWDGRAWDLVHQAGFPPLDPNEMNLPNKQLVAQRFASIPMYLYAFTKLYGHSVWDNEESVYLSMEDALATFQQEKPLMAPFTSQYDDYLRGDYVLSDMEQQGMTLFFDQEKTSCSRCHQLQDRPKQTAETFSNYHYYNMGVPRNQRLIQHNHLPHDYVDYGLFNNPAVQGDPNQKGKFKVPTLRNIAITAPYMHNGVFNDLRTVLLFLDSYNNPKRKINPETQLPWDKPEYARTIEHDLQKMPPLSDQQIEALMAFLNLLTDRRYQPLLPSHHQHLEP